MLLQLNDIIDNHFRKVNGVFVHPDIYLDTVVYKYIKKNYFIELMKKQQLYIANRASFSDLRERKWKENFRMKFLIAPTFLTLEEKLYYKKLSEKINEAYSLCISCWTYDKHKNCDESIMNWKCYGEDTYRIETSISDLIWSIRPTKKIIVISPVSYEKSEYDGTVYNAIFRKHISYQDEQEVRMCILSSANNELINIDTSKLIHKLRLSPFYSLKQNKEEKARLENQFDQLSSRIEFSHLYEETKSV